MKSRPKVVEIDVIPARTASLKLESAVDFLIFTAKSQRSQRDAKLWLIKPDEG